ncbi:hypothetical protein DFH09DRAFT_1104554 [Mycena vulgaris]|nr:hypothetical protein DFH09DRAFT_1104554 [Mycena vulgaris]
MLDLDEIGPGAAQNARSTDSLSVRRVEAGVYESLIWKERVGIAQNMPRQVPSLNRHVKALPVYTVAFAPAPVYLQQQPSLTLISLKGRIPLRSQLPSGFGPPLLSLMPFRVRGAPPTPRAPFPVVTDFDSSAAVLLLLLPMSDVNTVLPGWISATSAATSLHVCMRSLGSSLWSCMGGTSMRMGVRRAPGGEDGRRVSHRRPSSRRVLRVNQYAFLRSLCLQQRGNFNQVCAATGQADRHELKITSWAPVSHTHIPDRLKRLPAQALQCKLAQKD